MSFETARDTEEWKKGEKGEKEYGKGEEEGVKVSRVCTLQKRDRE